MSENYENVEIPGVGEIRARPGTSTMELAGAVKYWHEKCRSARVDGFIGGLGLGAFLSLAGWAIYYAATWH